MIRLYFQRSESFDDSDIAKSMFYDRGAEFAIKRNWDLILDNNGCEKDKYDECNPIYLIVTNKVRKHLASARLIPFYGQTMVHELFSELLDSHTFDEHRTWEVSRFLGSAGSGREELRHLMIAGLEFGIQNQITSYVGVTEERLLPLFAALGWPPLVLGKGHCKEGSIAACQWPVNPEFLESIRAKLPPAGRMGELQPGYRASSIF